MMRSQRGVAYGLALTTVLGLAFVGWTRSTPARADDEAAKAPQPPAGQRPMSGPASIAASGDFVYVVRGGTVYQMKAADLSVVTQKDLPAPGAAANNP